MFANVAVLAGEARDVVTVPRTSVTFSLYGDSLFVVVPAPPKAAAAGTTSGSAQAATPEAPAGDLIAQRRFVRTGEARGGGGGGGGGATASRSSTASSPESVSSAKARSSCFRMRM